MKNYKAILLFTFSLITFSLCSQNDISDLGIYPLELEIYSGQQKVSLGSPLLIKRSIVKEVFEGAAGVDQFFLEFKTKSEINVNKINLYSKNRRLQNRHLIQFHQSSNSNKTELLIEPSKVKQVQSFSDYSNKETNFYFYSINLIDIPIQLVLESNKIEIDYYDLIE